VPAGFENFFGEVGIPIDNEEDFSPPPPSIDTIDIKKIVGIADEKYGLKITTIPNQQRK
jgi:hypothetical protein